MTDEPRRGAAATAIDTRTGAQPEVRTLCEAFQRTSVALADQVAVRTRRDERTLTWSQWRRRARDVAGGLAELGVKRGDTVALMLSNRPEFHVADLAAVMLGATPFSIYQTFAPDQIRFVLSDAGPRVAVVQSEHLQSVLDARNQVPGLEHVILIDPAGGPGLSPHGAHPDDGPVPEGVLTLAHLEESGRTQACHEAVDAAAAQVGPDDILTLIYTSGTTGPPKGVQISHRNLLVTLASVRAAIGSIRSGSRVISWLPAAHIAERNAHHYMPIVYGLQITCCADPSELASYLTEVRPQRFFAAPRIWEKLKAGLEARIVAQPAEQRERTERALAVAFEQVRLQQREEEVPAALAAEAAAADEQIFSGMRATLGLDQLEAAHVGAAPTPLEVLEFFHAIGIPVAELWGMSESCGAGCVNPPDRVKLGTVGPPIPGVELRLADDGEVLLRGQSVMAGYRGASERTAEAIDDDGWLRTGDIGELDGDGYLRIVDRKKELIINAMGKNMSPANIEAQIKSASPLIGQAVAIGDRRPYNTALIVLDGEFAPAWASQHGLGDRTPGELSGEPIVHAALKEAIVAANRRLARVEQIRRFTILPGDWPPGGEELTPTMKLKRRPIAQKYAPEIEAMYA